MELSGISSLGLRVTGGTPRTSISCFPRNNSKHCRRRGSVHNCSLWQRLWIAATKRTIARTLTRTLPNESQSLGKVWFYRTDLPDVRVPEPIRAAIMATLWVEAGELAFRCSSSTRLLSSFCNARTTNPAHLLLSLDISFRMSFSPSAQGTG
jgi:hypothetical protein